MSKIFTPLGDVYISVNCLASGFGLFELKEGGERKAKKSCVRLFKTGTTEGVTIYACWKQQLFWCVAKTEELSFLKKKEECYV